MLLQMSLLLDFLRIPAEVGAKYGIYLGMRQEYNRRYQAERYAKIRKQRIAKGQTKHQKMERKAERAMKLREDGMTLTKIAKKIHVSLSTVKRYLNLAAEVREREEAKTDSKTAAIAA